MRSPLILTLLLASCNFALSAQDRERTAANQAVLAAATTPVHFDCSRWHSGAGTFPFQPVAHADISLSAAGQARDYNAQWDGGLLPRQDSAPIVVGVTRFVSVHAAAYWHPMHGRYEPYHRAGGYLVFAMEAFPMRPHPRQNAPVTATAPDGRALPPLSFGVMPEPAAKFGERPSTTAGLLTVSWGELERLGFRRTGLTLHMPVDGEAVPRTYRIDAAMLDGIARETDALMASAAADAADYMARCKAVEQGPPIE